MTTSPAIPLSLVEHQSKYKDGAWHDYSVSELGGIVAFFVKRASHRTDMDKRAKDLLDAQNYLDMIQAHVDEVKA